MKDKFDDLYKFLKGFSELEKSPEWDYEYSSGHVDGQIDLAKEILETFFQEYE